MSEGDAGNIGVLLVSAVLVRASTIPMVVGVGGSDLVCIAVSGLCSLVADAPASMDAFAAGADVIAASAPKVSISTAAIVAAR